MWVDYIGLFKCQLNPQMKIIRFSGPVEYSLGSENYFWQNYVIWAFKRRITRMYMTITTYKTSHVKSKHTCKKLPHLKNRITKPRIIATKLQPFSPAQFSKWAAYLKSRKKSDFFWKIFFPCNFVKKFPKDLGWCAIGIGHMRHSIARDLSLELPQDVRFLAFLDQNQISERPMVGPIWPGPKASQPRSLGYFLTKLHGKKIFQKESDFFLDLR